MRRFLLIPLTSFLITALLSACGAGAPLVIPTARPTVTATYTETPTRTPGASVRLVSPTPPALTATFGPSPTALFGPTRTPAQQSTPTRVANPNAPRIEFFTSDTLAVAPGSPVTLFWSTRGANGAVIYRLDQNGVRNQLWNVAPDGNLSVPTRRADRGQVSFVLSVGDGALKTEQTLTLPLTCPDAWFFQPAPDNCPRGPAQPTTLLEQPFERGRMVYVQAQDTVYALFNDGLEPAWVAFDNRYDPAVHPELDETFERSLPPGLVQPKRILGFVWRGNDLVRNRLGLGVAEETAYEGFLQTVGADEEAENLYLNSADGTVLQLLPNGQSWQIITPP
ncbi:MAG: hypothetical protein HZC41_20110 [Chloroflexi bacterium]|nr:hypothetical protein [Chloroflexota bacterium]